MPFLVSKSFSSNTLSIRHPSMPPSSTSQKPPPKPAISSGPKRPRPIGLWKARRYGPAAISAPAVPTPSPHAEHPRRRNPPESDSGSDRGSHLDATKHAQALVTKHQAQQHHLDYFSAIPQPADDSDNDDAADLANWTTRIKIMDISTTAGPTDSSSSTPSFSYEDWLDIKQLFVKASEQYESNDPAETLPLLRGIIHECHRCLLVYHDPSVLFTFPDALTAQTKLPQESGIQTPAPTGPFSRKTPPIKHGRTTYPLEASTSLHTLLGTALFFFGNLIAASPEYAMPDEPSIPVPYWIAALDAFESGENLPSRIDNSSVAMTYKFDDLPDDYTPPPREDWRMGVMWGRTLVALATEMVDRHRKNPPPPQPQSFPSPFPTNTDYLKTGTIWDDEPEWPPESLFGLIITRRPPITRRMMLNNATPHEILQLAMDHFSRGIFHMPHNSTTPTRSSRQTVAPPFSRSKSLYEIADEVLLLAEKLPDPEERKEWAIYADSVLNQILASRARKHRGQSTATASTSTSKDTSDTRPVVTEGLLAKARGRTSLVIGSTIAENIEENMDQASESEEAMGSLIRSEEAQEARDALLRAVDFFEQARLYIIDDTLSDNEELEGEDNDDTSMSVDDDEADDEQAGGALMSARALGKQRRDPKADEARRTAKLEARRAARAEGRRRIQKEAEEERLQLSHLLAEALCSLANLTESKEQQEELYRRAEAETGGSLFSEDDDMDEDQ